MARPIGSVETTEGLQKRQYNQLLKLSRNLQQVMEGEIPKMQAELGAKETTLSDRLEIRKSLTEMMRTLTQAAGVMAKSLQQGAVGEPEGEVVTPEGLLEELVRGRRG